MDLPPNFDLKGQLDISLKDTTALSSLCRNIASDVPELSWTNIPQIYLDSLTVENIELKSKIFFGLTIQKAHLNGVQRSILYNAICNEIGTGCDKIQIICHTTIIDFATLYLEEIIMLVKERLLSNIDEMEVELLKRRIKALSAIAKIHGLGCIILPKIVTILTDTVNTDICITILLNIQKLIALKKSDYNIHQFLYKECHIIDKLILYETNIVDHKMLISNICQLIVRNLTIEEQRAIVAKYAGALDTKIPETDVTVIMNLFISLRKDIDLNLNNDMAENLYNIATSNCNLDIRQTSCKFLSVLLNKIEVSNLDRIVSYLENKINNNLSADNDIKLKQHTVNFQIWMTKALVMRGYVKSQYFLENLVPLLIESLSLSNEYLVLWTLMSFKLLLDTKHDVFSDNLQCVIPRLIQLSTHRIMDVRIAVLECLAHYANYPTILINPYKQTVLDKLGVIIDDRKRLVRKAAVNARTRWYLVGASGEQSKE
ncbi:MMS19 nucleotide excision repair protein-like protein [Acromyrmex echinatior]|uniref:MMS19 nucleotide excision repair protein n=1 Tax=Acromyrmex echinatior TaxID=103372 RepID=F4WTT1_ACREC|nr:MMS19 nucleotide excision repair protein-like protein [Acromyrmex echinatior]